MSLESTAERLSAPFDWLRRVWFARLVRNAFIRSTLLNRGRRIATLSCVSIGLALLGAVYLPVLLFTVGPALFGVAHVAADVRYLVLRRQLARAWQNTVWGGCLWLIVLRVLEELGLLKNAERIEFASASLLVAAAVLAGLRERGSWVRAVLALLALTGATVAALHRPSLTRLVYLHLHNLIALIAWATLSRGSKRWLIGPLAFIAVGTVLLGSGVLAGQTLASPFAEQFHLRISTVANWLSPPLLSAPSAVGITTAYVFLQSVHYSVWLAWIPQEQQGSRGTPTFRMSVRSLFFDLGAPGVAAVVLASMAVALGACFDVHRARALYLSLATFHGYLELALLAFFWVCSPGRATRAQSGARL